MPGERAHKPRKEELTSESKPRRRRPATQKQMARLRFLYDEVPDSLTLAEASHMLDVANQDWRLDDAHSRWEMNKHRLHPDLFALTRYGDFSSVPQPEMVLHVALAPAKPTRPHQSSSGKPRFVAALIAVTGIGLFALHLVARKRADLVAAKAARSAANAIPVLKAEPVTPSPITEPQASATPQPTPKPKRKKRDQN